MLEFLRDDMIASGKSPNSEIFTQQGKQLRLSKARRAGIVLARRS